MKNQKSKKILAIVKFSLLLIILVGIPLYIYFFQHDLIEHMSNWDNVKTFFQEHKSSMAFLYLGAQALQIIICIVPGQWLQIAAGYFYGIPWSLLMSLVGALLGSVITYYLAKVLGRDIVHLFFGEDKIQEMIHKLNSKKATIIIFLIFLIPGIPKDLCNYAAGLSEMKLKPFLLVSMLGRTPGMLGSIIIGRQMFTQNYIAAVAVGVFAVICCILGIIYRKKVNAFMDKMYDKYIGEEDEENKVTDK